MSGLYPSQPCHPAGVSQEEVDPVCLPPHDLLATVNPAVSTSLRSLVCGSQTAERKCCPISTPQNETLGLGPYLLEVVWR